MGVAETRFMLQSYSLCPECFIVGALLHLHLMAAQGQERRRSISVQGACMARAGHLFGLLLIPTPVLGLHSTPRMGEWVGWGN